MYQYICKSNTNIISVSFFLPISLYMYISAFRGGIVYCLLSKQDCRLEGFNTKIYTMDVSGYRAPSRDRAAKVSNHLCIDPGIVPEEEPEPGGFTQPSSGVQKQQRSSPVVDKQNEKKNCYYLFSNQNFAFKFVGRSLKVFAPEKTTCIELNLGENQVYTQLLRTLPFSKGVVRAQ